MTKDALRWAIFAGLFSIPFIPFLISSSLFFPFITTKAFAWRIIVEVIFAAWVFLAVSNPEYRPKKSPLLYAVFAFILVVGIADLFGVVPLKSLWSNFERMEGYLAILHLGAFFLVISSMFREVHWKRWWNTSLAASALMVSYSFFQVLGVIRVSQSDARVDGTLGNAIYLAVYLLLHIFIALLFMYREWRNKTLRWMYGLLILSQIFILYFTATRGTILGLLGGLLIFALLNLRNQENKAVRKGSSVIIIALVALVSAFFLVRGSAFVQSSPVLSRFATLNLSEIKTQGRFYIWPMAVKGIMENPVLGWGQDNFNYIFQKYYQPEMYKLEPWFDRAHNVFLDWAVAGGILGLALYLSLYAVSLNIVWRKSDFSYLEKSILVSLIAAYFFHNLFVFDNLISYILFFSLLAYIHGRFAKDTLWQKTPTLAVAKNLILPAITVVLAFSIYFINLKPLSGNLSLIQALRSQLGGDSLAAAMSFQKAYNASWLGKSETIQQTVGYSAQILSSSISVEEKNKFFAFARDAVIEQAEALKDDVRHELLAGAFLSVTGNSPEAIKHLLRAKELSPNKQQIYLELAQAYYAAGDNTKAIETLQDLTTLSPELREQVDQYIRQIQNQ